MKEFIQKFTSNEFGHIVQTGNRFFMLNHKLEEAMKKNSIQPEYMGAYLGYMQNSKFVPIFMLLDILSKQTKRTAVINKKQEWLFTNKKDLNTKGKTDVKEGLVIVLNSWKQVLGLGEIKGSRIKNILDIGDFMRRER